MQQPLRLLLTKFGLLALLLANFSAHAQAPAWQTAVAAAGTVSVQATDTDGTNVYLTGNFSGTATFGSVTLTAAGAQEAFVARWNTATSTFAWAIQSTSTGTGTTSANAVVFGNSSVYVAGNFTTPTVKFGTATALTNAQAGTSDIFLFRVSTGGTVSTASVRQAGGTGNDYANASAFASGVVYVGGSNSVSASFGTYTMPTAGGFIVAYVNGTTLYTSPVPMGANVTALTISPTTSPSIYAAGSFNSTSNLFGNGSLPLTSAGGDDAFVARLTNLYTPTLAWAQRAGGAGNDYARAVQANGSSVFVAGSSASTSASYGSTTLTNAGGGVAFVAKLTDTPTAGTFAWAIQNGAGTSQYNSANALSATGNSVYLAGNFGGTVSLGTTTLTSAGLSDVLLTKLTDNGSTATLNWVQQAGGAGLDQANAVTRLGTQVYAAGQVTPPAAFGSLSIGTAAGARPGFLASVVDPAPVLALAAPNSGAVGTVTTLYGLNFAGATSITFAGSNNNIVTSGFTVNAAGTAITGVVVPSGAQSGGITVTSAQGSSNGLVTFTVLPAAGLPPTWQSASAATSVSSINWAQPDANGNVLVAGTFSGTLTLGGTTLTSAGGQDLFVAKLNASTNTYVWAVRAGSNDYDDVAGGLVVNGPNVYVAGSIGAQTAVFGGTTLTTPVGNASYVAKLTDAGSSASFTWAQALSDNNGVYVESLAVSGTSVYVGGEHYGTPMTAGTGTVVGNSSGYDGFITRFTDNGSTATFNWGRSLGGVGGSANLNTIDVFGLVVKGNTVYLSGELYGTVSFDGYTLTAQTNAVDVFVLRLNDTGTAGTLTAALATGGVNGEYVQHMVGQGNALYLAGGTNSTTWASTPVGNAGGNDAYVAKVTDTGTSLTLNWVRSLGGAGNDGAYQLALNGTGIYVVGSFAVPGTFGSTTLLGAGLLDGFVARLTDAGSSATVNWVQANGGPGNDYNYALALVPGKVYVGSTITPLAAFGSLAIITPLNVSVAALASLNDAAVLGTTPATAAAGSYYLYPNPAHGRTTVQLPTGGTPGLMLLDAMGREVRRYPATTSAEAVLDLQGVPAGLYVLRGAGSTGQKLVVE